MADWKLTLDGMTVAGGTADTLLAATVEMMNTTRDLFSNDGDDLMAWVRPASNVEFKRCDMAIGHGTAQPRTEEN